MDTQNGPIDSIEEAGSRLGSLIGEGPDTDEQEQTEGEEGVEEQEPEEGDESEGETDEQDEEADEDETQPAGQTYTVKVNGEELQVPLEELLGGYQRQADYTRKAQALAENRKALEAVDRTLQQERAQFADWAQAALNKLRTQAPPEVDWNYLKANDPVGYSLAWTERQQFDQEQARIAQQYQIAVHRNQEAQNRQLEETVKVEGQKLAQIHPVFADPQKAVQETTKLVEYGKAQGFSDEELSNVYDHRSVIVLRKAMLYDQLQASRPKLQNSPRRPAAGPVVAAGSQSGTTHQSSKRAVDRLRKSGRVQDAAALFEKFA